MDDHLSKLQLWEAEKNLILYFYEINAYYELIKSDLEDYDQEDMEILAMDISNALIAREVKKEKVSISDHIETFLMYDQDVPEFNSRLEKCNGTKICSNPCIELWFLLHFSFMHADIERIEKYINEHPGFRKLT